VEDYFAKIGVIALTLKMPLAVGRRIQVLGHTTNLEQAVDSMQIDHVPVQEAAAKSAVGIKVIGRARRGDHVYLLK
jgi:putative protease